MYPFGEDGPSLELTYRSQNTVVMCVIGFWLFGMGGSLLALGSINFGLLSQYTWCLCTLFGGAVFVGYWTLQHEVAWLIFWCLPMLHGLLWLQLLLVSFYGVPPSTLWRKCGEHSGSRLLMAQLGTVALLWHPLVALLAFVWVERTYLLLLFHDFTAQLMPEHFKWNLLWCTSPARTLLLACRHHPIRFRVRPLPAQLPAM
jgi:hypothetical protein